MKITLSKESIETLNRHLGDINMMIGEGDGEPLELTNKRVTALVNEAIKATDDEGMNLFEEFDPDI